MQEKKSHESTLELGMQELEAMEAPDFWSGFKTGATISAASLASSVAYSGLTVAASIVT
ncbi:daptide-type RiPP [Streptomyces rimosus]|uniref:daptide-type RiPP n=1 Tax=Streptomyces rimosus TaxID=1927 RepID=UPI000AB65C2F|nr:daptide-type RiPP [Streptomyces rimosus]